MAIFSFDGGYLDKRVEDFWACRPRLVLRVFMKYNGDSTFVDLDNGTIDNRLAKELTMWCGSNKRKLIVGSAQYKQIIETNLTITCLHVDVPDDEVVFGIKNPIHTLLPEKKKTETTKKDHLLLGEDAILFLRRYAIDLKPEMVDEYIVEATQLVHRIVLRARKHKKFLRILLQDFMVMSGIDTTGWNLMQFVTAPKFICHPYASYEIRRPCQIYSDDDYLKIETNAPLYKRSFSKIGPLAVYKDVFSLQSEFFATVWKLEDLVERAKKLQEKANLTRLCEDHFSGEPSRNDLPTTDSYHLEAPNSAEPKQQVIPNQTCIAKGQDCLVPDTVLEKTENVDHFNGNKQAGDTGDDRKKLNLLENRDTCVQGMSGDKANPASSDMPNSERLKSQHTDTSVTKNPPEANGDDANYEKARDDTKIPDPGEIPKFGTFRDKHTGTSMTKIPEITNDEEDKKANPASGEITQSRRLIDLIYDEMKKDGDEASPNSNASSLSSQSSNAVLSSGGKTPPVC